jgi:DNA-binding response OmpR family regulator
MTRELPFENADSTKATILIVEDEVDIRDVMKMSLEIDGFDVITAANGLEGLRRYKENQERVRVVVTDLDMPTMNGSDMIRQIFKMTPAAKVIIASGRSQSEQSVASRCLQKPYTGRELRAAVEMLL